jgi:hypothetical protein
VSDIPIPSRAEEKGAREVLAQFDAPAYIRRARQVEQAYEELLARCRGHREQCLGMARLRIGLLAALAGDWEALRPLLADEGQIALLRDLHASLAPRLRASVEATSSQRQMRRALIELQESIDRANRRWAEFLGSLDLSPLNELRQKYNRYYLLEKECIIRSPTAARVGFRPLEPITLDHLTALFPPMPRPTAA